MSRIFSSRRLQRPQVSRITVNSAAALLLGAGIGAGVMYLYDPARGRRRRRLIADRVTSAAHRSGDVLQKTGRDLKNHARGLAATARRPFRRELADDPVVYERVRSELGRVVSHPGAIDVTVGDGIVTLAGDVIDEESEDLLDCIADVRGVRGVVDHLTRHDSAEDVPVLQGDGNVAASRFELLQEHWTPAARLMTGLAGSALLAYSMRARYRAPTAALGAAGAGMLLRAATNMPFERLTGVGAGHRAITVRKSINIDASVDEVYGWLTEWERWPQWMSHVREVNVSDQPRGAMPHTRWVVDGPAGTSVSWDAAVTRLVPNELIAWKTVGRSPVRHAGRIRLTPTDQGATRVDVQMSYNPVLGAAGHAVAKLFRRDPERQLHDDLSRLKTTIETGTEPHDAAATRRRDTSAGEHPPIL